MGACAAPLIQRLGALLAGGVSRETVCPRRAVQVCCKGCLQRRRRAPDKGGKIAGFPQRGLRAGRRGGPLRRVLGGCLARIWPVWCVWCVSLWAGGPGVVRCCIPRNLMSSLSAEAMQAPRPRWLLLGVQHATAGHAVKPDLATDRRKVRAQAIEHRRPITLGQMQGAAPRQGFRHWQQAHHPVRRRHWPRSHSGSSTAACRQHR